VINTTEIIAIFDNIFNPDFCGDLAKRCKFIERSTSKIQGHEFIKALIIPSDSSELSLNELCLRMAEFNPDLSISAQALSQRINDQTAVDLMQNVCAQLLKEHQSHVISCNPELKNLSKIFSDILIEDSTLLRVNNMLKEEFPGCRRGKEKVEAQVKVNSVYSLFKSGFEEITFHEGKKPDQALASNITNIIKPGMLVIRDLGYFVLDVFQKIADMGGYYISRLRAGVKIYLSKSSKDEIDLSDYISKHYPTHSTIDFRAYLGAEKLETRIVLYKAPEEVVNQRLRNANIRAKQTGRTLSKSKKTLMEYSGFITNILPDMVSAGMIGTIYRLRWEIELIFKEWKSQLKINVLAGTNKHRIECLIWARMCMVILCSMICKHLNNRIRALNEVESSRNKIINYLIMGNKLVNSIAKYSFEHFLNQTEKEYLRLIKNKRRRRTLREVVEMEQNYYGCAA